jgi:hypothetical protein
MSDDFYGLLPVTTIEKAEHDNILHAKRVTDSGSASDVRLDYDVRTDDNPVYVGIGYAGQSITSTGWLIYKLTWDGSSRLTLKQSTTGIWNNRTSLFS